MISVDLIYRYVFEIIQKNLGTGYLDPAQFNAYANMATTELFNKYSDTYQQKQRITDKLRPFIKKATLPIDVNGHMFYPDDYVTQVAVRAFDSDSVDAAFAECEDETDTINYNEISQIKVKVIDNNKVGDRLSSSYLKPDKYQPIAVWYDDYVQWYPSNLGNGVLEYLREPIEVVWGFTTPALLEVYDSTTSVNFEFNWIMKNELIIKICSYFGVGVREEDLVKYSQLMQTQQA